MFCIAQEQIIEHENIKLGATGISLQHYTAQSMCHLLTELVTRFPDKKKKKNASRASRTIVLVKFRFDFMPSSSCEPFFRCAKLLG